MEGDRVRNHEQQRNSLGRCVSLNRINLLASPKPVHLKFIPDKPSVYWLDYLVDPTPHKITDPRELEGYYRKFSTPRLETLSKPKISVGSISSSQSMSNDKSSTGVSLSALNYTPTERIKQLAEPRPDADSLRATKSCNAGWIPQLRSGRHASSAPQHSRRERKARSRL